MKAGEVAGDTKGRRFRLALSRSGISSKGDARRNVESGEGAEYGIYVQWGQEKGWYLRQILGLKGAVGYRVNVQPAVSREPRAVSYCVDARATSAYFSPFAPAAFNFAPHRHDAFSTRQFSLFFSSFPLLATINRIVSQVKFSNDTSDSYIRRVLSHDAA